MENKTTLLESIEWHDLPLERLVIADNGLCLVVTPFNEQAQDYEVATLSLSDCSSVILDIQGELSPRDRMELEVSRFEHQLNDDGSLNGELGILPGSAGYWRVKFECATWELTKKGSAR